MLKDKSLTDLILGQQYVERKKKIPVRAILVAHQDEIRDLQKKGVYLREIYNTLLEIYGEEIKDGRLLFSEQNFYKQWRNLEAKRAAAPDSPPSPSSTPEATAEKKGWDNKSDGTITWKSK